MVVFPGTRCSHRPRNMVPISANLGLRLVRCPPLPTRDLLPVGHQPSTHPGPAVGVTAVKDNSTDGARDKCLPPADGQPLQPSCSPTAFSSAIPEEKAIPFPSQACELQLTRNPAAETLKWGFTARPRQGHCGFPGGKRGVSGTTRLCHQGQISWSFPSPSLAHLLPDTGMPVDEESPLHSTTEPSPLQRLRVHRPVTLTPPLREEQKLHPSIRKCVCACLLNHILAFSR